MKTVRCAIRKTPVAAHPEEVVRQRLLGRMIEQLGYPPELIVVERELSLLPHLALSGVKLPERRADILCYGKGIQPSYDLYPLLLIECKAVPLTAKVVSQVVGYNHYVKAYFIGIANGEEERTGWYDPQAKEHSFVPFLPGYRELLESLQ